MKFTFLFIFMFFLHGNMLAQEEHSNCSVELNGNYRYYQPQDASYWSNFTNRLNCGASLLFHIQLSRLRIGLGLSYQTKNIFSIYAPTSNNWGDLRKEEQYLKTLYVPLLLNFKLFEQGKFNTYLTNGILANRITGVRVNQYFSDRPNEYNVEIGSDPRWGFSYRVGFSFEYQLNKSLRISCSPFLDYKFKQDFHYSNPDLNQVLKNDKYAYGISLGFAYQLTKKTMKKILPHQ